HSRALLDEHLEHPFLLLLVLDGLVVHHAEAANQGVKRLIRAVVAQRLQRLHAVGCLHVLVYGTGGVLFRGALVAPVLRKPVEKSHVRCRAGVYTRGPGSSMPKTGSRLRSVAACVRTVGARVDLRGDGARARAVVAVADAVGLAGEAGGADAVVDARERTGRLRSRGTA